MTKEVINYLYKHCLIGRKDRQMIHLIYQTVREKVNILGKQSTFLFFLSRDRKDFREQFQIFASRGKLLQCCEEWKYHQYRWKTLIATRRKSIMKSSKSSESPWLALLCFCYFSGLYSKFLSQLPMLCMIWGSACKLSLLLL